MTDPSGGQEGSPVAVIVHERRGNWARQLRPRLQDFSVRWVETRSPADLAGALDGLAAPVVVIDLGNDPAGPLEDLARIVTWDSSARVLVIDPEASKEVKELARELGATHVVSGFAAPPDVAELIARWVALAAFDVERFGWSRPQPIDPAKHPMEWIESLIAEAGNALGSAPPSESPSADS